MSQEYFCHGTGIRKSYIRDQCQYVRISYKLFTVSFSYDNKKCKQGNMTSRKGSYLVHFF